MDSSYPVHDSLLEPDTEQRKSGHTAIFPPYVSAQHNKQRYKSKKAVRCYIYLSEETMDRQSRLSRHEGSCCMLTGIHTSQLDERDRSLLQTTKPYGKVAQL